MKYARVLIIAAAAAMLAAGGCSFSKQRESAVKVDPTATPTPTPTPVPTATPTPTPAPTSTPAPRMIGTKTSQSKYVFITNNTNNPLREVYLRISDTEDWGRNMVPNETTVKAAEKVQMFYDPPTQENTLHDMKIVDKSGNSYAIYYIDFSDMENASLRVQDGSAYLSYMSLSSNKEASTQNSETLATDYSSGNSEESYSSSSSSGSSSSGSYNSTVGNPDYGYYDDNGNWVSYSENNSYNDSSVIDATGSTGGGGGGGTILPNGDTYDPSVDYSEYEGNSDYGYYNEHGVWESYY